MIVGCKLRQELLAFCSIPFCQLGELSLILFHNGGQQQIAKTIEAFSDPRFFVGKGVVQHPDTTVVAVA